MKKLLLLSALPILLFSCSKGDSTNKQEEVSYAQMMISLKDSSQCRKANIVKATYTIIEETDNWDIIGYQSYDFETGYEHPYYKDSWTVVLNLDQNGDPTGSYEPSAILTKPYLADYFTVSNRYERMQESEGTEFVKFYLKPARIFLSGSWQSHDTSSGKDAELSSYYYFDEVFDKEQWVASYTEYEYQYIYNNITGVKAYRKLTKISKFKYQLYY